MWSTLHTSSRLTSFNSRSLSPAMCRHCSLPRVFDLKSRTLLFT